MMDHDGRAGKAAARLANVMCVGPGTFACDAKMAARLRADEHGMRNYVIAILKTGSNESSASPGQAR